MSVLFTVVFSQGPRERPAYRRHSKVLVEQMNQGQRKWPLVLGGLRAVHCGLAPFVSDWKSLLFVFSLNGPMCMQVYLVYLPYWPSPPPRPGAGLVSAATGQLSDPPFFLLRGGVLNAVPLKREKSSELKQIRKASKRGTGHTVDF